MGYKPLKEPLGVKNGRMQGRLGMNPLTIEILSTEGAAMAVNRATT